MTETRAFPVPFSKEEQMRRPKATEYCMIYGMYALMSEDWHPDLKGRKTTEEVYEECLFRGCTWQELLGFTEYATGIIL